MRFPEFDLEQIERALARQNQAWQLALAALGEFRKDLQFCVSNTLKEELDAALSPTPMARSNPLGKLGLRA